MQPAEPSPHENNAKSNNKSNTALFDPQALQGLRDLDPRGDTKLLERVISAYFTALDRLLPELAQARTPPLDFAVIHRISHTLKSSSASLGATALSRRCAHIEMLARNQLEAGLGAQLDALLVELAEVRSALNALR